MQDGEDTIMKHKNGVDPWTEEDPWSETKEKEEGDKGNVGSSRAASNDSAKRRTPRAARASYEERPAAAYEGCLRRMQETGEPPKAAYQEPTEDPYGLSKILMSMSLHTIDGRFIKK